MLVKIPTGLLMNVNKLILKYLFGQFHLKYMVKGHALLDIKHNFYKYRVFNKIWHFKRNQQIKQLNRIKSPETKLH